MAKTHSGGGKTPRNVGVKTGPPSANKIDPGSASRIGRSVGNHTERGTTKRPAEPLVTGSMKQVPLGNTVALNGSGSGARPGGGDRKIHERGSQGQHGPAAGSAAPKGRDILSQFGPESKGGR
jgi:hypothetical protein